MNFLPDGMVDLPTSEEMVKNNQTIWSCAEFESLKETGEIRADTGEGFWSTDTQYHPHLNAYAFNQPTWAVNVLWRNK